MIKNTRLILLAATALTIPAFGQPSINNGGVVNAASSASPKLPGYGIAQGSIFSIYGSNMGPTMGVKVFQFPLQTTFEGTSIAVTVNGTTVNAIPLFTRHDQVNAIMPSDAPVGTGTMTVTYNGQTSAPSPVTVVATNIGIFTVAQSGSGPGVFTDGKGNPNSFTFAANPGETLNLWVTGMGAGQGPDNTAPVTGDFGPAPSIYVGGAVVQAGYWGRSGCCAGLDQIQFKVPQNISGCNVPVSIQRGNDVSNFVSMSIAQSGETCSDAATGLSGSEFEQFFKKGDASIGVVSLERSEIFLTLPPPLGNGTPQLNTGDGGDAIFLKYNFSGTNLNGLPFSVTNYGACYVFTILDSKDTNPTGTFKSTGLDAGSAITVSGPNGVKTLPSSSAALGSYFAALGADPDLTKAGPLYLSAGSYTVTGPGGKDVGAFSVDMTLPQPFTWTNQSGISTIPRANPLTLTWSGGDPNGYMLIGGFSFAGTDSDNLSGAGFYCSAKVGDQQFTVPSVVLLSLPPSANISAGGISIPTGNLSLIAQTPPVSFTATGLDLAFASSGVAIAQSVTFQ